ncbi:winged helix-turn-helix domain-containing protein [Yinghuangia seranimata]|uniref:winged helix-turn-helix domain-containing protein n=1 Tax=Yinghuangia seranimata TaxID=408067 RepID=UPI00248C3F58|nr:response regulator transcription factor [Yinghuangia seranimata]MDI2125968.1 response regulator transcription factor [Yinghuangia seranimata]
MTHRPDRSARATIAGVNRSAVRGHRVWRTAVVARGGHPPPQLAVARRTLGSAALAPDPVLGDGRLVVDPNDRTVSVAGRVVELAYLEFQLLHHLMRHPRMVFTRGQLMSAVWGYPEAGSGRTVDVHVARLRRKLGAEAREAIVTVRHVGYKYVPKAEPALVRG